MLGKNIKKLFEGGPAGLIGFIAGLLALLVFLSWIIDSSTTVRMLNHSEFFQAIDNGEVTKIKVSGDQVLGTLSNNERFESTVHFTDSLWNRINDKGVEVIVAPYKQALDPWLIFGSALAIIFLVGLWLILRKNKNSSGSSSIFSFGKSRFKKIVPGQINIRFSDVAGAKNAKEALTDIIDFLKDPERFKKMGAHIPKGILLSGEPGNGKTLLARAVAGEAQCNFLSISGADFIEVFVGVGAARIRDLFAQARKSAPCILFIDEIDAIGRSRGSGFGGGHDEREQTLNQLLTEMDGFDQYQQPLVVMAATNIPEVLDKALLRPGRFDRIVHVPYPNYEARLELLKIHSAKSPLSESINLEEIASYTQGLSGADMENLVNMAALRASQAGRTKIEQEDFSDAYRAVISSKRDMQQSSEGKAKEFLPQQVKTKFSDVAGNEEAKEDLKEVVDFLKNPKKYHDMGARIPHGVLMVGDPGTGKTLLARAVAGEAGVPFFYASASQFIQKYVGEGAGRIRELFTQARKNAPSIIFIDELDSIGKRDASGEGGNKEYNQTINQLLTEMDGFMQGEDPVVVLAATNLKEGIDEALKRAGRFDRHVNIPYPNLNARIKILQVHARGKKFGPDVSLETVAKATPGFSGAALENLLNESAILAVSRSKEFITNDELEEISDRIMIGKKNIGMTQSLKSLEKTAYHEAGHALATIMESDYPYRFHKVTILSRGGTLGVSHSLPQDDQTGFSREELEAKIVICLSGRVAEEIAFGKIHTGAVADFQMATDVARKMVMVYGMSNVTGVVSYIKHTSYSQQTAHEIDQEIKAILERGKARSYELLTQHRETLNAIAKALLEQETLDAITVYRIAGIPMPTNQHEKIDLESV